MKRTSLLLALIIPVLLSACASDVDLNKKEPVDNIAGTTNAPVATTSASTTNTVQTSPTNAEELARQKLQNDIQSTENKVVYFDFNKFNVKSEFAPIIEANTELLKRNPSLKVDLQGNTDSRGSREYNLALGQRRADAVQQALQLQGVNSSQIQSISFGKEKPAVQGDTEQDMALNRRVNFAYHNN